MNHEHSSTGLLRGARDCHDALRRLAVGPIPPIVTVLLAGHSLEIGLKAFLLQIAWEEREVKGLGHDLIKAWAYAKQGGLDLEDKTPWWCEVLSSAYDRPYLARYTRANSGLVLPNNNDLIRDLGEVLDKVTQEIINRGGTV
jgi:hypothetical protein